MQHLRFSHVNVRSVSLLMILGTTLTILGLIGSVTRSSSTSLPDEPLFSIGNGERLAYHYQMDELQPCGALEELRDLQTPEPITPEPTTPPTATPENGPTATPRPTPLPAPQEDRIQFPATWQEDFKLLFIFDRPDNQQVRVICGNEIAASVQPGEPFPYGSVLLMATYATKKDENGQPVLDENGHYVRERLTGLFLQQKEEGWGEGYAENRSGEWEYISFRPNGEINAATANTGACAACHLNQAGESVDFVFRMDMHEHMTSGTEMETPALAENEVAIMVYGFSPEPLTVKAGTTVTWYNYDQAEHTVTAVDGSFDSGVLQSANVLDSPATFSYTFDEPGTYEYVCSLHRNMNGTVIVEAAD